MFLPRENVRFVSGSTPVLLLEGAPINEALPVLRVADGVMPACEGWQVDAKLTMSVVDGPGDAGCLVQGARSAEEAEEMSAWCGAVEEAGGAVVISLGTLPEQLDWDHLFSSGQSRGGFMTSA
ncbi:MULTISPECIES: hypothetical protein [unclassified Streptomyces]|uniref:hypothetical protein n=1 Tax=unclassified Streptomyces TaxID=2593676 RepID=UPI002DDC2023|nr:MULTISPECIES: hypothetical protein [unclassified Streptomyces]WSA92355.1 hypothetical protein OIE63_12845 [Streptomyces sp. NBC_01795]WSB76723.1 hypothetical protein OHB04_13650 [Streptomyces sp. NBC_01775]WSS15000.1 hypothetical protein OG533_26275 [Streptomyces sp. NBC_01186]WSS43844.1 hypothetical protein OG220_27090 [Streptomyces sp. NBC_01187]